MSSSGPGGTGVTVVVGPSFELHSGVHAELLDHPPPGVEYRQPPCALECLFPAGTRFPPNPFDDLSLGDAVAFDLPAPNLVVHSSRLPVANGVPWLAENDCLLSTIRFGPFWAYGPNRTGADQVDWAAVRLRERVMLDRFLDDQCEAVLFMTEYARTSALRRIGDSGLLDDGEQARLWGKSDVVHPALAPRAPGPVPPDPVSVVYVGRTFEDKGGPLALAVFAALHEHYRERIRLVFVGELPAGWPRPPWTSFLPCTSRREFLDVLASCHIFFSPTLFESPGMALLEAAAAGLAVVTSRGPGMEHIQEILIDGVNALLISNSVPVDRRIRQYLAALRLLVDDCERRLEMSGHNRALVERGVISLGERDQKLVPHYENMAARVTRGPHRRPTGARPGLVEKSFSEAYLRLASAARGGTTARRLLVPSGPSREA